MGQFRAGFLGLLVAGVVGGMGGAHATELAALDRANRTVYRIDTSDLGNSTLIGTVGAGTDLYQLTDSGAGTWYTFDRDANSIITISQVDAHVVSTVALDQDVQLTQRGFDVSPGGALYGVLPGLQLRTINPATGATSLVANITGAARVEAIAFSPDGRLFASGSAGQDGDSENLYLLNPITGAAALVGTTGVSDIDTLAFGDGQLFGANAFDSNPAHLWRLNLANGAATDLGNTNVLGLNGLVVIPEPATAAGAILSGGIALATRRAGRCRRAERRAQSH